MSRSRSTALRISSAPDGAALIFDPKVAQDVWLDLEDGVQIQFVAPKNAIYRTGDYWLIPARVATGDVEWSTEIVPPGSNTAPQPLALPPDGVNHHYAPLAIINVGGGAIKNVLDCRLKVPPLSANEVVINKGDVMQAAPAASAPASARKKKPG